MSYLSSIPKDCRTPFYFWRLCGQCLAHITTQGANRDARWATCPYHPSQLELPSRGRRPSKYAVVVERILRYLPHQPLVAHESKVLGGSFGAMDFTILVEEGENMVSMDIEVDGETHGKRPWGSRPKEQQQQRDAKKDEAAWAAGRRLVRLHHNDIKLWGMVLKWAAYYAAQSPRQRFILYSKTYSQAGKISRREFI